MTDDLDRELRTHLELEAEEQREAGLSADDARYAALRALGNRARVREDVRALSPLAVVHDLAQDLRYGLRMLVKHPGFTIVAALTLALGIGANTAMFSVVDAVLLRPLPYAEADRLAMVWENVNLPAYKNSRNTPSPGNFNDWRKQNTVFADMAAIAGGSWSLTGNGEPARVNGAAVSATLFPLLQVHAALGRIFTADDDRPGNNRVAVLGHGLWAERFGADPGILGRTIHLDEQPHTVIGVMPRGFSFPDADDKLWVPIALTPQQLANHDSHLLRVVARLKPRVTLAQAQANLNGIAARLTEQFPLSNTGVGVAAVSLQEQTVGDIRAALLVMLGVVGFLLLMVCANIGNLLLARASARGREFAVRTALGAGRGRLVRQLLTESALLAVVGGVLGLTLASWGITALRALAPASLPRVNTVSLNASVAAFNFGVALLAGLICGVVPALQAGRRDLHETLKADARGSSARSSARARNGLIVVETALGVIVLVGAGLLLRSFLELGRIPLGFAPERVLTFRVALSPARYTTLPRKTAFYQQVAEKLQAQPGVQSAAGISFLPLTMAGRSTGVTVEGDPPPLPGRARITDFRSVTPGYFSTMGIPLLQGRDVAWSDTPEAQPVVVISETMARTYWPNQDAIGKRITLGRLDTQPPWITVVGLVGNVQQIDLIKQPRPAMYFPASQDQRTGDVVRDWAVKTSGDAAALASSVPALVWTVDPALPVTRVQTMQQVRGTATAQERFNVLIVALFAAVALILAAVGLYGVTAYSVAQRTRELGIRLALGARPGDVMRLVLGDGTRLVLVGVALGTIAALGLTRMMATLLFGVGARDPITFAAVGLLLAAVSLVACYIPARRAMRVDPVVALRS
jgi:putative ABC transport system permease protein